MREFVPTLHATEETGGVHLTLDGVTGASGPTLQDAADELVRKLLLIAMAFRSGHLAPSGPELRLDPAVHDFIWDLAAFAAQGGDIRHRLFDAPATG